VQQLFQISCHFGTFDGSEHTPFQNSGDIFPVFGLGSHANTESNRDTNFTNNKECFDTKADEQDSCLGVVESADLNVFQTYQDGADHVAHTAINQYISLFFCFRSGMTEAIHEHNQEPVVFIMMMLRIEDSK
jgi:hypothetical protein